MEPIYRYDECGFSCRVATASLLRPRGLEAGPVLSMMPVSEPAAKRRIGDILLEHGSVSEGELADATAEQERTGQPLGQILVQHGSITRLELASALAEQWSDPSASISLLPRSAPASPPAPAPIPSPQDEAQYAARLQEAVVALSHRVQSSEPLEGINERVTELSQRIESTLARTQRIEAAVATLADSFEGVTGGVEDAFVGLQAGTAVLAADLARIDETVRELATRPVEAPQPDRQLLADLEALRTAVAALVVQQNGVEVVSGRLEEIAPRLDTFADAAALDDLRGALRELERRPGDFSKLEARFDRVEALAMDGASRTELEVQASMLADLRDVLTALEARPAGTPALDARLERLEAALEVTAAAATDTTTLDGVVARLDSAARRQEDLAAAVEALDARVGEIPTEDTRVARERADHDSLAAELHDLEAARITDLDTVDVLARAMDRIRHDLTSASAPPAGASSSAVEAVAQLGERVSALEATGGSEAATTKHPFSFEDEFECVRLAIERVGLHLGEHDRALADLTPAVDLASRLEDLAARIEAISSSGLHAGGVAGVVAAVDTSGDMQAIVRRVEEAELASRADRERLMTRLERLATSMDWRLQRLEGGDAE